VTYRYNTSARLVKADRINGVIRVIRFYTTRAPYSVMNTNCHHSNHLLFLCGSPETVT